MAEGHRSRMKVRSKRGNYESDVNEKRLRPHSHILDDIISFASDDSMMR